MLHLTYFIMKTTQNGLNIMRWRDLPKHKSLPFAIQIIVDETIPYRLPDKPSPLTSCEMSRALFHLQKMYDVMELFTPLKMWLYNGKCSQGKVF